MKQKNAAWTIFCGAVAWVFCCCGAAPARADQVICVNKSGKLAVRSACKHGESKLNRDSLRGPQGLPGRGIGEALAGGTGVRGVAGGAFQAPGIQNDPWVVSTSFGAVLPAPVTSDKVIISQKTLRSLCRASANAGTVSKLSGTTANDCLRRNEQVNGQFFNQLDKPGQFDANATDNVCDGTPEAPTAPPGFVCIYLISAQDFFLMHADTAPSGSGSDGFTLDWASANPSGNTNSKVTFSWAYTAPLDAP